MELTVTNLKEFKKAISTACLAIEKKNTMPVLSHVKICHEDNRTYLISTDIETSVKIDISKMVTDPKPGVAILPGKILKDYVSKVKQPFKIETINNEWSKVGAMQIASLPAADFPAWPKIDKVEQTSINNLSDKIKLVLPMSGESDTRYTLNGLYFDFTESRLVGTDGHRLGLSTIYCDPCEPRIVPRKTVSILKTLKGDVSIQSGENHVVFNYDGISVLCRAIDGTYPTINNVLPKQFNSVCIVDRELLTETLSAVSLISRVGNAILIYCIAKNKLEQELVISASSPDIGEMEQRIPCIWDQQSEIQAGFNARYLLDALATFTGPEVVLCFNERLSPLKIVDPEDPEILHIVMPMRLDNQTVWAHSKYPNDVPEEIREANKARIMEVRIARRLAKANKRLNDYKLAA